VKRLALDPGEMWEVLKKVYDKDDLLVIAECSATHWERCWWASQQLLLLLLPVLLLVQPHPCVGNTPQIRLWAAV
jgi:hypothetical protein